MWNRIYIFYHFYDQSIKSSRGICDDMYIESFEFLNIVKSKPQQNSVPIILKSAKFFLLLNHIWFFVFHWIVMINLL